MNRRRLLAAFIAGVAIATYVVALRMPRSTPAGLRLVFAVNADDASTASAEGRSATVERTRAVLENRVRDRGADSKATVDPTDASRIVVETHGPADANALKGVLMMSGRMEMKLIEAGPAADKAALLQSYGGQMPPGTDAVMGLSDAGGPRPWYLLRHDAAVSSDDLSGARPVVDEFNLPAVSFTLTPRGIERMSAVTKANVGRQLAIVIDDRVLSAPRIEAAITQQDGRITGNFSPQETKDLALFIRSGGLPAPLTLVEVAVTPPVPGQDSAGFFAGAITVALLLASLLLFFLSRPGRLTSNEVRP